MTDTPNPDPLPQDDDTAWPEHDNADPKRTEEQRQRERDAAIDRDTAVTGSPDQAGR